jgi:hypothetical protein
MIAGNRTITSDARGLRAGCHGRFAAFAMFCIGRTICLGPTPGTTRARYPATLEMNTRPETGSFAPAIKHQD